MEIELTLLAECSKELEGVLEKYPEDLRRKALKAQLFYLAQKEDFIPRLTPRETQVLALLVRGDSNKEIARELGIAEATVKVVVKAMLGKARLNNRTQLAVRASRGMEQAMDLPAWA